MRSVCSLAVALALAVAACRGADGTPAPTSAPAHAWAVGATRPAGGTPARGIVLESHNNGLDWEVLSSVEGGLDGVTFVSPDVGWAVGAGTILSTTDGGRSWREQVGNVSPEGTPPPLLRRVRFITPEEGIAVGGTGGIDFTRRYLTLILYTRDAGQQWTVPSITGEGNPALVNSPIKDACFTRGGNALAVGYGFSGDVVLLSTDRGASWIDIRNRFERFPAQPRGVACVGDSLLWIVGGGETTILHSRDGGNTWVDQSTNTPPLAGEVLAATFLDGTHGLASGVGPFVLRTTDAGEHWTLDELPPETVGGLLAIDALPGVAVGVGVDETDITRLRPVAIANAGDGWRQSSLPDDVMSLSDVSLLP